MAIPSEVKHIVFDFGAVIINIDVPAAYKTFSILSGKSENEVRALFEGGAYWRYEVGELSDADFRNLIRESLSLKATDAQIDLAWNTLLLDVPASRIALLKNLSQKYPIYLLSNTNPIHIRECTEIIRRQHKIENFRTLFRHCFMSYEIGMMKPSPKMYQLVLDTLQCDPHEILFLDDNVQNIAGANAMGFHTALVTATQDIHYWLPYESGH